MNLIITRYMNKKICAWFDENRLVQINSEPDTNSSYKVGDVYIGKVKNIVKNINAAFVDIGDSEPCFLQIKDTCKLKREEEILVQIQREGIKTKQAAVTMSLSIPGKYLVLTSKPGINVSNKIKNVIRRKELASWIPDNIDYGFIVRTNAEQANFEQIDNERRYLEGLYNKIQNSKNCAKVYSRLYEAPEEYLCAVRDCYDKEIDKIITDDIVMYEKLKEYISGLCPEMLYKLSLYKDESYTLPSLYGLQNKIEKALAKKVWLNSGAYLVIEQTEACTVIDVNTGKAISGKRSSEDTFFKINCEAAHEIIMQLRLRNLSGIIIIDFIDMNDEHNNELMSLLKKLVTSDPVKTTVVDITKLGLVELTRMKQKKSLSEQFK